MWAGTLLELAFKGGQIEENAIPVLDSRRRAQELQKSFNQIKESPKLYYQIFLAYQGAIAIQWGLCLVNSFSTYAPHFIMFKILKLLEGRSAGIDIGYEAWFWVVCLGLTKIAGAVVQSYQFWCVFIIPVLLKLDLATLLPSFECELI